MAGPGDGSDRLESPTSRAGDEPTRIARPPEPDANDQHSALAPGQLLAHTYVIEALLARGGMGEVYRARHAELGSLHAIKIIRPEMADDAETLAKFTEEAKKLRTVRNDAVVAYEGFFRTENGVRYLVMEYVDGTPLSRALRQHRLAPDEVRKLRSRLAEGLEAAHDKGIYHRDISPDNVLLVDGRPESAKIIDFGIAKSSNPGDRTVVGKDFAGKYSYASPEQLGFHGGHIDARSDIYSLGLVLIAAAQGRPLDMGGTFAEVLEARKADPDLSGVPAELRDELAPLVHPHPADRPQSVRDLPGLPSASPAAAQRPDAAAARPIAATKAGPRSRTPAIAAVAGVLAAAIAGIGYVWFWPSSEHPASTAANTAGASTNTPAQGPTGSLQADKGGAGPTTLAPPAPAAGEKLIPPPEGAGPKLAMADNGAQVQPPPPPSGRIAPAPPVSGTTVVSPPEPPSSGFKLPSNRPVTEAPLPVDHTAAASPVLSTPPQSPANQEAPAGGPATPDQPRPPGFQDAGRVAVLPVNLGAEIKAAAEREIGAIKCAELTAGVADDFSVTLAGFVGMPTDRERLLSQIRDIHGVGRVDDRTSVYPWPQCAFAKLVRPGGKSTEPTGFPRLEFNNPSLRYRDGDFLVINATALPARGAFLYVDYIAIDGVAYHMLPSEFRKTNFVAANQTITLGTTQASDGAFGIEGPLYGTNMIVAVASAKRLFPSRRPDEEPAPQYLQALAERLNSGTGGAVSATYAILETTKQ